MLTNRVRPQAVPGKEPLYWARWLMCLMVALALALASTAALSVPPAAGTSIGNQASASYTDGSGAARTVTSNTVNTIVQQVASLTLTANGAKTASVGSTVYYPHVLTNTGNGSDTYTLGAVNAGGSVFNMTGVTIYADNGSGLPTGPAITSTGPLAAGSTFKFIVAATVPGTATSGQTNSLTVTGTSVFNALQTLTNTDVTTVTANAVVTVTKAVSVGSGLPGTGPYTYTLTYTNTGNSTATAVKLTDTVPVGMTMVANSGLWSVTGATALTNATATYGTLPNQITYDFGVTTAGVVTATLSNVAPGQSGFVSFKVNVNSGVAPGAINNTAGLSYNDGSGATITGTSNTVPFNVLQVANVTLTPPAAVASANPGSTVPFANTVTNTGNGTDTFNMSLSAGSFPVGTSFVLYKSDGVTPLIDTNSDGIPDTGPLAAGASYIVIVKAVLPASAAGTGPFTVNKTAKSVFDNTKSAVGADTLTAIAPATMDVTNNAPIGGGGVVGVGAGPEATAQVTKTTNPGTTTTITVVANNTGPIADSYNLDASTSSTLASITLPAGWTVVFKADGGAGNCSTTGATITNTGTVNAGASSTVCAVVSVPAGFTAGTTDLYFRAQSPSTGAKDTIHDAVTVNAVRALSLTPNNTGQVFPGGSTVYTHSLTNNGNVVEGNGTVSTITFTDVDSQAGWTSILYYDANGNGVLDASDPVIPATGLQGVLATGLASGQTITVFNKVTAPSGVTAGVVDTTTLTATTANGSYTSTVPVPAVATDSTTVISGNVTLVKTQALNASCSGLPGAYSTANITTGAIPGACIDYQITVQNVGAANATGVTVSDTTPAYTLLNTVPATTLGTITTTPSVGAAGTITATIGTLLPSQTAIVTFRVKIVQ
jgi:trimeric autotransporter adhesin